MSSKAESYGAPETRTRILEAAWALLEEGDQSAALSEVARRAGVSRQAIYLHFGDRNGLFLALAVYSDDKLGLAELAAPIMAASSGREMLDRMVELNAIYTPRIDPLASALEAVAALDEDFATAWRNRMSSRLGFMRVIVERLEAEGDLAKGWTIDDATSLLHATLLPGAWRELTQELGWTADQYIEHITRLVRRAFLRS